MRNVDIGSRSFWTLAVEGRAVGASAGLLLRDPPRRINPDRCVDTGIGRRAHRLHIPSQTHDLAKRCRIPYMTVREYAALIRASTSPKRKRGVLQSAGSDNPKGSRTRRLRSGLVALRALICAYAPGSDRCRIFAQTDLVVGRVPDPTKRADVQRRPLAADVDVGSAVRTHPECQSHEDEWSAQRTLHALRVT
jgi:hypothetical protein